MAKDIFHQECKEALENASWTITHDPYRIIYKRQRLEIDLGAEEVFGAEREGRKIAIEVKSFIRKSNINSFHEALGQYRNYYRALKKIEPNRILYLAVPVDAYKTFFLEPFGQDAIEDENLLMIVFDPIDKKVVKWIH